MSGKYTDLVLKSADGGTLKKVHKFVIASEVPAWGKILERTPKKGEIATKLMPLVLSAVVKFCYKSYYVYSSSFAGKWNGPGMTAAKREAEFHFRVFQGATDLGMEELRAVTVRNIKLCLGSETNTDDVAGWLLDTVVDVQTGKLRSNNTPMDLIDAVNEMQARAVARATANGTDLQTSFHNAVKGIPSLFLVDFIQAVAEATGVRLGNYLTCRHCACVIRSKNMATNTVMCNNSSCKGRDKLGRLVIKSDYVCQGIDILDLGAKIE